MRKRWLPGRQEYQVDLVGPTAKDYRWQAREQSGVRRGRPAVVGLPLGRAIRRSARSSLALPHVGAVLCVLDFPKTKRRTLSVRRQEAHFALRAARQREQTEEFIESYAQRAGVEGVHAEANAPNGSAPLALYWRIAYPSSACCHRHRYEPVSVT